jgi:folate-binding protein YgfZ
MLEAMSSITVSQSEYDAIAAGCGLVDRSERGKLSLTGGEAKSFLQGQVSNDVEALTPGRGCYAAFLTPKGKMLGDLRILDAGAAPAADPDSGLAAVSETGGDVPLLLLDTERVSLQELFNMIRRFSLGYDAELHKRTLQQGLLSLLGPDAAAVAGIDPGVEEHSHRLGEIGGIPVRAVRTDLGVDLFCRSDDTGVLTTALLGAGATAVSEATADVVRIERGRPRYGVDLDDTVIPQEADLNARAVSFTKGCYVGQETVARLYYRGKPNRHLRGVRLSVPAPTGAEISFGGRTVGRLGSVVESPALGTVALALVRREAPPGSQVSVGPDEVKAVVVELPFER